MSPRALCPGAWCKQDEALALCVVYAVNLSDVFPVIFKMCPLGSLGFSLALVICSVLHHLDALLLGHFEVFPPALRASQTSLAFPQNKCD